MTNEPMPALIEMTQVLFPDLIQLFFNGFDNSQY